jgi:hypothetical protein
LRSHFLRSPLPSYSIEKEHHSIFVSAYHELWKYVNSDTFKAQIKLHQIYLREIFGENRVEPYHR